jgi:hypothetical protein
MSFENMSDTAITTTQAMHYIKMHVALQQPVMIHGGPGIGKSSIIKQFVDDYPGGRAMMVDIRLPLLDPTDLRGIPFLDNLNGRSVMAWAPPIMMPSEEEASKYDLVVLFLDEINGAAPAVQAAAYQLVLDRRVGEYVLPSNVAIVAAGNRASDQGVTFKMPAPLRNRFTHYEIKADFKAWLVWAENNSVSPDVLGFLMQSPKDLYSFDSKTKEPAFPTPRSWVTLSTTLKKFGAVLSTTDVSNMASGTIGSGTATHFQAHRRYAGSLPTPDEILSGKVTKLTTRAELSGMYTLMYSLVYGLRDYNSSIKTDEQKTTELLNEQIENLFKFLIKSDTLEPELAIMVIRLMTKVTGESKVSNVPINFQLPNAKAFIKQHGSLIASA